MICNGNEESDIKQLNLLKGQSINTLAFRKINFYSNPKDFLDLNVSNLIITESNIDEIKINEPLHGIKIFSKLNTEKLDVLTSIDNIFQNDLNIFDWEVFKNFQNIKAIHFEGGKLLKLDSKFGSIFGGNILTATFDNTKLENIETNVFEKWLKLKMLTINRNLIDDVTWISSELPNLWYLDLRFNKLLYISQDLISKLPSLRVFKLGDNKIRVISFTSIEPLSSINEFSFEKTIGKFVNHTILKLIQEFFLYR